MHVIDVTWNEDEQLTFLFTMEDHIVVVRCFIIKCNGGIPYSKFFWYRECYLSLLHLLDHLNIINKIVNRVSV